MSVIRSYLDYNATAPLRPQARAAVLSALDDVGNASSVHAEGRRARALMEAARVKVAALAGASARHVVFTSGATEAINCVVAGRAWKTLMVSAVEHPAVAASVARSSADHIVIPVDGSGRIDVGTFSTLIDCMLGREHGHPADALIIVQHANNETGVVQPIEEIAHMARDRGIRLMIDAVQSAGRVEIDQCRWGAEYLVLSSHKIGGPQGAGALVATDDAKIDALLVGGGQERGRRAGTENIAAIAGFGVAAGAARSDLAEISRMADLRARLEAGLINVAPDAIVIGKDAPRLANTSLIALPRAPAETAVIALDLAGVAASAGAACSSGKKTRSPVLAAMGIHNDIAKCAVRFSLGWATTEDDVSRCIDAWQRVNRIRSGVRDVA
jgi:cysteine desulfurase